MTTRTDMTHGQVYRCEVCGAEVTVISGHAGRLRPRCCNRAMTPRPGRLVFYVCPVCGSEVAVVQEGSGDLRPHCCNKAMVRKAA